MKLKEVRQRTKKDPKELANHLGITLQAYYRYERDEHTPSIDKLIKLADYYNVSIDYLVGRIYQDDLGYISPDQRDTIRELLKLSEKNLLKANIYITGLIDGQNEKMR